MKLALVIIYTVALPLFEASEVLHDYFVSITEIEYNATDDMFEMSIQLEAHDMERAIEMEGDAELLLGSKSEHPDADALIEDYIKRRMKITVDGTRLKLQMIGKVVGNDERLFCFVQAPYSGEVKNLEIQCRFLTDVFPDQQNIIHTTVNGVKKSETLTREKYKAELKY